jgi:hypothetical protein
MSWQSIHQWTIVPLVYESSAVSENKGCVYGNVGSVDLLNAPSRLLYRQYAARNFILIFPSQTRTMSRTSLRCSACTVTALQRSQQPRCNWQHWGGFWLDQIRIKASKYHKVKARCATHMQCCQRTPFLLSKPPIFIVSYGGIIGIVVGKTPVRSARSGR